MAEYQVDNEIRTSEAQSIVAWLKTLTDDLPTDYIKPPQLPQVDDINAEA
jgi:hypothetical protein